MKLYEDRLKAMHGYEEGRVNAVDPETSGKALAYKKDFLKHFIPIDQRQIETRLAGDRFYVTRKYDGEYAMIVFDRGTTVTINRSGRVRRGIPCIEEAGRLIAAAGIREDVRSGDIGRERRKAGTAERPAGCPGRQKAYRNAPAGRL